MKKKAIVILLCIGLILVLLACTENDRAKNFGGTMTIDLEPNQKLEEITWKEDEIWYLTRPMRNDEVAETHKFQEDSSWGIIEGTVIIVETKK